MMSGLTVTDNRVKKIPGMSTTGDFLYTSDVLLVPDHGKTMEVAICADQE